MWPPWLDTTGTPGKARPTSSAVRSAPTLTARSRRPPHAGAGPGPGQCAAPRAVRHAAPGRQLERAAARAAGHRAAGLARQHRQVPAPRDLDEDGAGAQGTARRLPGPVRDARRGRSLVAGRVLRGEGAHHRSPSGQRRPGRLDRARPPADAPLLRDDRTGRRADHEIARGHVRAQRGHVPGVPVGRLRVDERVVAVVPHDHEAQVGDRGEDAGAGAHDHARAAAQDADELPVSALGSLVGGQGCHHAGRALVRECGQAALDVGGVRHHHDHAAPGLGQHRPHEDGQVRRPGGRRRCRPDGPSRHRSGRREARHQRRSVVVRVPAPAIDLRGIRGPGRRLDRHALGSRVPGRHGRPDDVAEGAGAALGHLAHQGQRVGREHRLDPDDALDAP